METTVLRVLIIMTSVCSLSAKHVYIKKPKTWLEAQNHCRTRFTDLSPITNHLEEWVFNKTALNNKSGWIGLYRDASKKWRWSGGGEFATNLALVHNTVTANFFDYVYWSIKGWHVMMGDARIHFFCLNLIVADVKLTWEEALLYCREKHTDLTSLLSETEILLAKKQLQKVQITERVWIGLRYLGDCWLWVNGHPLWHEAWPQGGDQDHLCPIRKRCGALTNQGLWENYDCQEKLNFICH